MPNKVPGAVVRVGTRTTVTPAKAAPGAQPHLGATIPGTKVKIRRQTVTPHLRNVTGQWS
jgi:hypothetical protein